MALDSLWEASFPDRSRPALYSSAERADDGWLPLTDADDFLVDSLAGLDPAQLYALTANNAEALQKAQQEWTQLERLAQHLKTRDPFSVHYKDPQELPRQEIFEERKEAVLYNYKYEAHRRMLPARFTISENVTDQEKFDCREPPEPFSQGGFIPNEKQYKSLMSAAKSEGREKNPDNQKPYETNFAFEDRPPGTWVAKMLQPEAPPPPRTRAREAALNGGVNPSDRLTRFNGEKVPPTRGLSTAPTDVASPRSRVSTPVGGASPALKKRKIDAVDVTGALPKKKHPNQYTKRREAEEAAQLAAAQDAASQNGQPVPMQLDQTPPEVLPVKKKHPNQYTKRREREEAERRAREESERQAQEQDDALESSYQASLERDRAYRMVYDPVRYVSPAPPAAPTGPQINPATGKPKHPNQYTKRREREEAERLAALHHANATTAGFVHSRSGTPSWMSHPPPYPHAPPYHYPQPHPYAQAPALNGRPPPTVSQPAAPPQPQPQARSSIDTSKMNKEELRTHVFKDTELVALLEKDHAWIHDDPDAAAAWKAKILNSDYPVRTWAMLRKWKEWRAEGKDKRPRDKDGNRIREPVVAANTNGTDADGDAEMADVESAAVSATEDISQAPPATSAQAPAPPASAPSAAHNISFSQSPTKRPTRLRTRATGLDSPQALPTSPLVNGINARDLDFIDQPSSLSFNSKLQSMDQLDSNAKVDSWRHQDTPQREQESRTQTPTQTQAQRQTEYAANTRAGKGALRQLPRVQIQGTEDELYPSSAEHDVDMDVDGDVEQEGMLKEVPHELKTEEHPHGSDEDSENDGSSPSERSSSPSTDPGERDTAYRSGTRSRPHPRNAHTNTSTLAALNGSSIRGGEGEPIRRTRSRMSTRSLLNTNRLDNAGDLNTNAVASNAENLDVTSIRRTRSREQAQQQDLLKENTTTTTTRSTRTRSREQPQPQTQTQPDRTNTVSPIAITKRSLRPNPPKRTLTGDTGTDSEMETGTNGNGVAATPTRRSLRNAERGVNGAGIENAGRRESVGT
ncbi:hypothetical protein PMZ80_008553 [Knufia obscura]|uniref:Uncharacterized protein n=2 Tax=Knufia TaxID=430999 RepID=A0AAN8ECH0_9EURO|nr:hypothetical protein PMZ80_008553 [Knufia obscura]KAK5952008.1 hypothetical protein OHC33_006894 [Knufia fluminis]